MTASRLRDVRLIDRSRCFQNSCLAATVVGLQQSKLDSLLRFVEDENERAETLAAFAIESIPTSAEATSRFVGASRFACAAEDVSEFPQRLGDALALTLEQLGYRSVIAAMERRVPWLAQSNDFPPVAEALDALRGRFLTSDFDGGLEADLADISALTATLFWLTRGCASLPQIYFVTASAPWVGSLCQYGVLHVEFFDASERTRFTGAAMGNGFEVTQECTDPYSCHGAINGRAIRFE
ncbi:MAG: hypothetical protein IPK60_13595 [Sandaracinaceae bacterium]|nr:hypothetical protein [Sandaracinaceae bacterium]